jgi:hypothetical protein
MSPWPEISLSLLGFGEVIFLLPLGVGLVILIYSRTNPQPSSVVRRFLSGCRGLVIMLILIMLAEPAVQFVATDIVRSPMVLLVDTSKSMAIEEQGNSRLDEIRAVIRSEDFRAIMDQVDVSVFGFAEVPYALGIADVDTAKVFGRATDISSALRYSLRVSGERGTPLSVLLMTDGGHNLGDDPVDVARELGIPIFSLQAGHDVELADAQIVSIKAPEVGYVGQHMSIQATVASWGFSGRADEVMLLQGSRLVGRQPLVHGEDGEHQSISFEVEPDESGPQLFRVVIPTRAGDRSQENNESQAFVRILEGRVETLIIAGGPSADLAFAQRSLHADSTLSVSTLTQKTSETFYEVGPMSAADISGVDVFVLIDPGREVVMGRFGESISRKILSGAGLLFVGGQTSFARWSHDSPILRLLPATAANSQARFKPGTATLRMTEYGRIHPVTRAAATDARTDHWARLPPLPGYFPLSRLQAGALVLIENQAYEKAPIVSAAERKHGRVVSVASGELWRLDLISSGADGDPRTVRDFWTNAVKWLASESRSGRVSVSSERNVYKGGEEVVILGQVLDQLARPVVGADLEVALEDGDGRIRLMETGPGSYRGNWRGLDPGTYSYSAKATVDGKIIGEDSGTFVVEQHSVESVSLRPNGPLLAELARVSGGKTGSIEDWRSIVESMPLQRRLTETNTTMNVRDQKWLMAVAILFLTLEWYIRKRQGMI